MNKLEGIKHKMKNYDDILYLKYPLKKKERPLSMTQRSSQFLPFSALVGFEQEIQEKDRKTREKVLLSEEKIIELNEKINYLLKSPQEIQLTYFRKDQRKEGGEFITLQTRIVRFDLFYRKIYLEQGEIIQMSDIMDIILNDFE